MTNIVILTLLALVNGLAKAMSDSIISFKWHVSFWKRFDINGFFGISGEQKNKWKDKPIMNWLMRNSLVWLTDGWHLGNTIQMFTFCAAMYVISKDIYITVLFWLLSRTVFHVFYTYVFLNKKFN